VDAGVRHRVGPSCASWRRAASLVSPRFEKTVSGALGVAAIVGEAASALRFSLSHPLSVPIRSLAPDLDLVLRVSVITVSAAGPESRALLARIAESLPWWPAGASGPRGGSSGHSNRRHPRSHGRKRRPVQPKHGKEHVRVVAPRLGMYSSDGGRRHRHLPARGRGCEALPISAAHR
jgi:hypothetical protein